MGYLFMVIAVIAIAGQNTLVALFNKKVKNSSPFVLAVSFSAITLFAFLIYCQFNVQVHWLTAVCGLGAGVICFLNFIFLQQALKRGPVSLTNLFVSYSLLIPTFFSLFVYEKVLWLSLIIGIILLCASIAMTNKWEKKDKKLDKKSKKGFDFWWIIFTLLTVVCNGSFAVLQVVFTKQGPELGIDPKSANSTAGYMILAMSVVLVANLIGMFATKKNRAQIKPSFDQGWKFVLPNGVVYFVIILMQMWLTTGYAYKTGEGLNPSVFNPVLAAGSLILTLLASIFIFKEKLSALQWAGVAVGVAAIVVLNVPFVKLANWSGKNNYYLESLRMIRYRIGL